MDENNQVEDLNHKTQNDITFLQVVFLAIGFSLLFFTFYVLFESYHKVSYQLLHLTDGFITFGDGKSLILLSILYFMIGSFLVENKTIIKVYGSTLVLTFILFFTMPNHDDDLSKSVSEESILQIKQYQGESLDIISLKKAIDKNLISHEYSFMCGDAFWVKADNYHYTYKDIYILEENIKSCDPFHLNTEKTFCNHTKNDIKDKQRQALGE